jgi:hypothetical protein
VLVAATATAASCGATAGPATPALAGGVPGRSCPAGARADIPAGDESPPTQAAHVDAGFYAQTGLYWPPTTVIACRTGISLGHPLVRTGKDGCTQGAVPFLIPDDTASPTASTPGSPPTWGTFLPPGWYYLGSVSAQGWTELCWSVTEPNRPATGIPTA